MSTITKKDLALLVSQGTGCKKNLAAKMVDSLFVAMRDSLIEALADGLQGPDSNGSHQRSQQQHQYEPETQFLCHTEVGKTSLHGRNHCA